MKIDFIGLGNMGQPMARNLLHAGHDVIVYNRTPSRAEVLQSAGARVASSPAAAARDADVLITMVADDGAVQQIMFGAGIDRAAEETDGALAALPKRAIHLSMSTIGVALSSRLAQAHKRAGQGYVVAPVFGRPEAAAQGILSIAVAGPADQVECCYPIFEALGQDIMVLGQEAPIANAAKLAGNFLSAATIGAIGEAFALVRKSGLAADTFLRVIGSVMASSKYEKYGVVTAEERFESMGFSLAMGLKDLKLLLEAAHAASVPMPVALAVYSQFLSGVAHGQGHLDWTGAAHVTLEAAGLIEKPSR